MNTIALGLLLDLRSAGLEIEPSGDRIRVSPQTLITQDIYACIVTNKQALLAALDLELRILRMARRWHYSDTDLADVLKRAPLDPVGWELAVSLDEGRRREFREAGLLPESDA